MKGGENLTCYTGNGVGGFRSVTNNLLLMILIDDEDLYRSSCPSCRGSQWKKYKTLENGRDSRGRRPVRSWFFVFLLSRIKKHESFYFNFDHIPLDF